MADKIFGASPIFPPSHCSLPKVSKIDRRSTIPARVSRDLWPNLPFVPGPGQAFTGYSIK